MEDESPAEDPATFAPDTGGVEPGPVDEGFEDDDVDTEMARAESLQTIALIEGVRVIEPIRAGPPAIVQAAAVAATGFVAGAATAAVLGRRRTRQSLASRAAPPLGGRPVGPAQTFLVHVQQIRRP